MRHRRSSPPPRGLHNPGSNSLLSGFPMSTGPYRTQGVRSLVEEVLCTLPQPYSEDVIDEVCLAIEGNPQWLTEYRALCNDLRVWVVNNWIGQWVSRAVGRTGDHQVAAQSSLIETY